MAKGEDGLVMMDDLWIGAGLATMEPGAEPYGGISAGAIGVTDGVISYVGSEADLADKPENLARRVHQVDGGWITPGLIDCHTHLVYGGNRAREFELRLEGASYEEIARSGGGIVSTVAATRAASEDELVQSARTRLKPLLSEGVTTVEIKSGYGLDVETEMKMLRAARRLAKKGRVRVKTTFLGAHALPAEYDGRDDDYIDMVVGEALPAAVNAGLVDAVDAFCEGIAFSTDQTRRVFAAAQKLGVPVKIHAEQLSDLGGAAMAASEFGALSADHLEYLSDGDCDALAKAGTVAVLLPGAFYFLRETKLPPMDAIRKTGVPIAIATDSNPGSSPVTSMLLMLNMACTLFRMTPEEALTGVTRNAAKALSISDEVGTLTVGKRADFALWDVQTPGELSYRIGFNPLRSVYVDGAERPLG